MRKFTLNIETIIKLSTAIFLLITLGCVLYQIFIVKTPIYL